MTSQHPARCRIRGMGTALPERVLTNDQLADELSIESESIFVRTGIQQRRVCDDAQLGSDLGVLAAQAAIADAAIDPGEIDLLILSTYTPDHLLCPTGPVIADRIGATNAGSFDVNAACSGGVTTIMTAISMLNSGMARNVLAVTADTTTKYIRHDDPKTRLVFGDGAAAILFESAPTGWTVLASKLGADGSGAHLFRAPLHATQQPAEGAPQVSVPAIEMNGRAIFRFGVEKGATVIEELCQQAGVAPADVACVIPHQANLRILDALKQRTQIPDDRWIINIRNYGNTASSSVPIAWIESIRDRGVQSGDVVLLVAFGAGLTWTGLALRAD